MEGVVTGIEVGFHGGLPASVFASNAGTSPVQAQRSTFLIHPGPVRFDDITVCNHDPAYPPLPTVGDALLFVVADPAFDAEERLFTTPGAWLLYEHRGALITGPGLRDDQAPGSHTYRTVKELLSEAATR